MATNLPPKKEVAIALLERSSVLVHLDPRGECVRVPKWFKNQAQLVLQVGLNLAVRIPDLDVDDEALSCTLSFNRSPHFCYVPWDAVYALVGDDGRGMVWPEDVPPEVASQNAVRAERPAGKPKLRSVPPPADPAAVTAAPQSRVDRTAGGLVAEPEPLQKRPSLVPVAAGLEEVSTAAPRHEPPSAQASRSHLRLVK